MNFRVGMKVVYVGCDPSVPFFYEGPAEPGNPLIVGEVYTIREIDGRRVLDDGCMTIRLEERSGRRDLCRGLDWECGYRPDIFRPAVSPKSETSFTQGAPLDSEQWDNRRHPARVKEIGASA